MQFEPGIPAVSVPTTPTSSSARTTLFWFRDLSVSVVIAIIVILFLYQPVKVEGTSMTPALVNDERIFINKFVYRFGFSDIVRGDTIVFWAPEDSTKSYIKRVIGIPGDLVEIVDGTVILNGQRLEEPYIQDEYRDRTSMSARKVEQAQYFVLGDHRNSSNDSRSWGTVARDAIYGKAVFVYWPLNRLGLLH
ncbi:MAG: signal peptidase [Bryobacterales bacterium]|nr:signal peptidase [Bryobacterales bacterium]